LKVPKYISNKISTKSSANNHLSKPIIKIAVSGIVIGMAAMMLTIFIVKGFQKEVRDRAVAFGGHIQITKNSTNNSSETLPISSKNRNIDNLGAIDNVKRIQHFVTKNGIIKTKKENEGVILKGVGKGYDWGFIGSHILEGSLINTEKDTTEMFAMISKTTSDRLNLKCNDPLIVYFILTDSLVKVSLNDKDSIVKTDSELMNKINQMDSEERPDTSLILKYFSKSKKFRIKAIYETGMEEFDKKIVFTSENSLKKICLWPHGTTGAFEILLKDFNKIDETSVEVSEVIQNDLSLSSYSIKESNPGIFEWLDMHDTTAWIIIILMIVVAVINMVSALIILIIEKISMIGLLKAFGMRTSQITIIFMDQAAKIILKGLLIGNILGLLIGYFQYQTHFFKLDQSIYYMPFIPIKFEWLYLIYLNLGTFSVCMLFMLLPCIIVAKTSPIKAIRFD
jgi:lipoprotein-releasing system permease protein